MDQSTHILTNFTEGEKKAYLGAIAAMAGSDGQTTQEEQAFLQALCDRAELSEQAEQEVLQSAQSADSQYLQQHLDTLKTSELRFSLITDLISFAQADGAYTEDEKTNIGKVAQYLGVNQQQFDALNQFVQAAGKTQIKEEHLEQPEMLMEQTGMANQLKSSGIPMNAIVKGALGILGPLVLSRVLSGGGGFGRRGGMGGGMMGGGGGLGGMMGGGLGSILGGVLGGMGGGGGLGGMMGGYGRRGGMMGGGGMGSLISILGGLGNRGGYSQRGGMGGLLGGLGSILGGGRR